MEELGVPEGFTPTLCILLGYGAGDEEPRKHEFAVNRVDADCKAK